LPACSAVVFRSGPLAAAGDHRHRRDRRLYGAGVHRSFAGHHQLPRPAGPAVRGWQGLTTAGSPGQYLITGTTTNPNPPGGTAGLLYVGPITAQGGAGYVMVMPDQPGATTDGTTAYSADNLGNGQLRIVGTYSNTSSDTEFGFMFGGTADAVSNAANYVALPSPLPSAPSGTVWNIPHSTSGGLVVGNFDESGPDGRRAR